MSLRTVLLLLLCGCAAAADLRFINGRTRVIAHRGGTGPDGTVAGCLRSLDLGIVFLELDVRLTKDGHAVILHDPTVDRTTTGAGPVAALTLAELQQLDAGAKFGVPGERVPTVAQLLRAVGRRGMVLLELKLPEAGPAVVAAIRAEDALDRAVVRSADLDLLATLKRSEPRLRMGTMAALPEDVDAYVARLTAAGVSAVTPKQDERVTPAAIRRLQAAGIAVWGTNTNDPAVMRQLIEAGADGIITDRPELLQEILRASAASWQ